MSEAVANKVQINGQSADAKKAKAQKRAASAAKKAAKAARAPNAVSVSTVTRQRDTMSDPSTKFNYVLGESHDAMRKYLKCIYDPKQAAGVPGSAGNFELNTKLWVTVENGTIVAGSNGVGILGLCCPNWVESGNTDGLPDGATQTIGVSVVGATCFRSSNAAVAYNVLPLASSLMPVTDFTGTLLDNPMDNPMLLTTRIRLVSCKLSVRPMGNANTVKGEVMLAGTVNPTGGVRGGDLNAATWDDLEKTNPAVLTRSISSLTGWKAGTALSIVAIPGEAQAFEMCQPLPIAWTNPANAGGIKTPIFHLTCATRGMAPGDLLAYTVDYCWETELAKTYSAQPGGAGAVTPSVPQSTLSTMVKYARPHAHDPEPNTHIVPLMQTLAQVEPMAAHAIASAAGLTRPSNRPIKVLAKESNFWGGLGKLALGLHNGVTSSGLLMRIPVVGPAVQAVAGVLSSLFD